MMKTRYLLLY